VHIAFATHARLEELTPSDRLAAGELSRRGATVTPLAWSASCEWRQFEAVVIRATWDYHTRPAEFRGWLRSLEEERVSLWNPASLAAWNLHKGYLRDLERAGVPIVPTAWVSSTQLGSLDQLIRDRGWTDVVVKPAISASAHRTWLVRDPVTETDEHQFRVLAADSEVMVQPFLESLPREGEWSFVFLGGEFSHAVLKRAAAGDFRVQSNYGGTVTRLDPSADWVRQARAVLDAVPGSWLYARVDGCILEGRFVLVELEMLEPDLFLNYDPQAPARFADSLLQLLREASSPAPALTFDHSPRPAVNRCSGRAQRDGHQEELGDVLE
jgi:glutathione synthase/RimK-type ligase-like ATP-grasp enzyme